MCICIHVFVHVFYICDICTHFIYADFILLFTCGCLVRDDLIKKYKQTNINRLCQESRESISWWRHQMETFSALLALCEGNSPFTCEFPSQKLVRRSFDVFWICAWTTGWINNRDVDDLRRHRAHYDFTVMIKTLAQKAVMYGKDK